MNLPNIDTTEVGTPLTNTAFIEMMEKDGQLNEDSKMILVKLVKILEEQFHIENLGLFTCRSCGATTKVNLFAMRLVTTEMIVRGFRQPQTRLVFAGMYHLDEISCCRSGVFNAEKGKSLIRQIVDSKGAEWRDDHIRGKMDTLLIESGIPDSMHRYTFRNFKTDTAIQATQKRKALAWADFAIKNGRNKHLILHGVAGNGKTHTAVAIMQKLLTQGKSVGFMHFPEFLEKAFNKEYQKELAIIIDKDFLIVDDIGKGAGGEHIEGMILVLLDGRALKSTVFTTNSPGKDLKAKYGSSVSRRLFDDCETIKY